MNRDPALARVSVSRLNRIIIGAGSIIQQSMTRVPALARVSMSRLNRIISGAGSIIQQSSASGCWWGQLRSSGEQPKEGSGVPKYKLATKGTKGT